MIHFRSLLPGNCLSHRLFRPVQIVVCAAGVILFTAAARGETIDVFLLGGQSNMDGRAAASGLPSNLLNPQPNVLFDYGSGLTTLRPESADTTTGGASQEFGPEVTFGYSMAQYYASQPNTEVAIIKYAVGGTNLYSQWAAGGTATEASDGPDYVAFQNTVNTALAAIKSANPGATVVIAGMDWMQGESDAVINSGVDESLAYQTNLTNFIDDVRLTYGADLPFVIGELSVNQTGTGAAQQRANVMAAQVAVSKALPDVGIVNTNSFPLNSDNLHFSTVGQEDLGDGFATQMEALLVPEPDPLSLLLGSVGLLLFLGFPSMRRKIVCLIKTAGSI
jgi:hypothetical protein